MKRSRLPASAAAIDSMISRRPISTSWPLAFMLADQISDFMPRCSCSTSSAKPRTKGSFQKRWL